MKVKKIIALLLALLTALSLCACGKSARASETAAEAPDPGSYSYAESYYEPTDDYASDEAEYFVSEPASNSDFGLSSLGESGKAAQTAGTQHSSKGGGADLIDVEKIIYSANATIETTDFDATLEKLESLIARRGGFVESSSINGSNYYSASRGYAPSRSAEYRIRIPAADFSDVMGQLSTLGSVPYSNTYSENITSQYFDVQSRLNAYRTEEQSLLAMLEKAENVTELLEIQDHLSDVRYNIESLQSKLTNWDRKVSYSTISLSIQEVQVYTPETETNFLAQLGLALKRGLRDLGEFFADLLLWLSAALPTLIVLALIAVGAVLLVRRARKRRSARRAEKAADAQSPVAED